ncbi:MAG: ribonucleoside-diphosphate reductase subunit alpha [Rickettsiales bacterium]|nr:ribonucleoside-diphosphate reductase subunit alpha [Pseudomonadota bacterium]MDA0966068.1 ribonucleoside-diphosphate reductase subunit alpha [Pseudomonadota bacterium]MDG4544250.1 ribonucleoside-diphosphate reductase subunit alpha [Rickettsiales bacterium]MDG4546429.1 ribonucleoside-diphosphate reductase subunit alpha [Rickettsiales bacterium]MDG4548575.1 ribonucleoside-diphosphate reductase subunit alpha [Rickettsiales bacterium]
MNSICIDNSKDNNLTEFGKAVLADRYLLPGETYQTLFARVSAYYGDDKEHAQRLYDYMSDLWFMPATPILSNGGTKRGLPISCFLNETEDSLNGIVDLWNENVWLAARGGGIGSYWGNLRAIGETVRGNGKTSGVVPFIRVQDSLTLAISQGSLRRGSSAVYLPVWHPEIEEFIDIRRPTGGDPNRKALNIHHAVVIPDDFMKAVERDDIWELRSPKDHSVISIMKARDLWIKILTARLETGEPYLLFIDNVNKNVPESYKRLGLKVKTSNLCSEITLATGYDHHEKERTAVCCLSSLNLERYDEWCDNTLFITDIMRMLDNVLQDFIDTAPPSMYKASYSASRERSIGLGVMGFHSFLQAKSIPMESVMAKVWNSKMFKHIRAEADKASELLAEERGACPDAEEVGLMERFTHKLSIAPTASISIICGNSSPGIEPYAANSFTQKTLTGSFVVRNKNLKKLLGEKGQDNDETWSSIATHEGSVQQLDFLTDEEKDVYKTSVEVDQRWVIEHAADRTPYICQAQSVNVFLPGDVHKSELHDIHYQAWKKGLKSLYYCRSTSIQRAEKVSHKVPDIAAMVAAAVGVEIENDVEQKSNKMEYDECLACQ